jgi:large subunit ribosomal protein L35
MPKIKTNRGAAKRFRATGNGGFKCRAAKRRHQMRAKSSNKKRHMACIMHVRDQDLGRMAPMLPYV